MDNLFEGLREGDLERLVLPMVSVDEYDSKLDDDSIVIAFFVEDREPAQDLNRFIQKGATALLDTDVSPAPNEDGYYMVFVEMLRDEQFTHKLIDTLESINSLTGLTSWKAMFYDVEGVHPVTPENIGKYVRLVSQEDAGQPDDVQEDLTEFFKASDLENVVVEGRKVTLEARGVAVELQLVDLGSLSDIIENNASMAQASRLDESAQANVRRLRNLLGENWIADQRGDHIVVAHLESEQTALFKL